MTAQDPFCCRSGGRLAVRSFQFIECLCGGPRVQERRGAHEVIGNDAEADPASGTFRAMVATAPQAVPSFDHTDAAFAPDAPALSAPEPSLSFIGAPRRCLSPRARQDDPSHAAARRRLFIGSRRESAITRGDVWGAIKHREMPIQRRRPQRHIGRPPLVHVVGGNDLMLGFLNRDELAEFGGFRDLAFPNRFRGLEARRGSAAAGLARKCGRCGG
jgi:hypothetical protein